MNLLEKLVYDAVKGHPKIKCLLRDAYQSLFDLLPVKAEISLYPITTRKKCFFGFHDHTPFSPDNSKLLSGRFDIPLRMPNAEDQLQVGFFSGNNYEDFTGIVETIAWNWHQGAKLQWLGTRNAFAFNDHDGGENISRIYDCHTGTLSTLPAAISSSSMDGKFAVGYSFARLERSMPGYGYKLPTNEGDVDSKVSNMTGIYIIDLETRKKKDLFAVNDIIAMNTQSSMKEGWHFITHCLFSPSGKRFAFLHRWVTEDVRHCMSTLMTSNLDGSDIRIYPTDGMVSHLGWKDDNHLLSYCRVPKYGDKYVLFDDRNPKSFEIVGAKLFRSDGHPSYDPSGRWIITDTYPDRHRRNSLLLFDQQEEKLHTLAKLKSPKKFTTTDPYRHWQCDLHPRWDRTGTQICFDSTYTGERALCTISLKEFLNEKNGHF